MHSSTPSAVSSSALRRSAIFGIACSLVSRACLQSVILVVRLWHLHDHVLDVLDNRCEVDARPGLPTRSFYIAWIENNANLRIPCDETLLMLRQQRLPVANQTSAGLQ